MIITALKASDFRKYADLHLTQLPERGLIAVIGCNESGKSSIGDAIQFGLFGCTAQLDETQVNKLIRWGTEQTTVTLHLQHRGHAYHLIRSVNQAGDTMATLFSTEEGLTLADTPETVEHQLKALLGYNHKAFAQAFYWSQQTAQLPQGDNEQLLALAGLKEYANLSGQLQNENRERIQTIAQMNDARKQLQANLNGLQIDEARLPQLESIGTVLEHRQQSFLQLAQRIDKETEVYPGNREQFSGLKQKSEKLSFWTRTTLMVFVLMLLTGLFLLVSPPQWLSGMSGDLREMLGKATIRVAALTALAGAALLIYGWFVEMRQLRPLRLQANRLADTLMEGFDVTNTPADQQLAQDNEPLTHEAARYILQTQADIPAVSSDHPDIAVLPEWAESVRRYELNMNNLQGAADALNVSMEARNREFGRYLQVLNGDKAQQHAALNQREQYQAQLDQQEMALEHIRRDRVVFDTALDLLQRSGSQSVARFNQLVQQRCTELLQRFTNGHYETIQLMPDFSLKVLSEQKGAYLDFIETSAGTQRQIALAMRVAVANALADNTHTTHQVLFLDEPLAFFDPERSLSTLQSLQTVSQSAVSQVWLTAQTVPEGVDFARVIHCPQASADLHA